MNTSAIIFFIITCVMSIFFYKFNVWISNCCPEKADIPETLWGNAKEDKNIYPFNINVSEDVLNDLRYRLEHTRPFTEPLEDNQWYGLNGNLATEILEYWKTQYDWKIREKKMNRFPQFTTNIQGLKIHFIHVKPQNVSESIKVLPLLMVNGWPGSVREFYDIIPVLTTPSEDCDFVFEVIAPNVPGIMFSEAATKPGLGTAEVALIFKNLMNRLGFWKFYGEGGDVGSLILQAMSRHYPDSVLGIHLSMCSNLTPFSYLKMVLGSIYPSWIANEHHQDLLYNGSKVFWLLVTELGYMHLQATKPDTLGISMNDSPMGLAAYFFEKYATSSNFDNRALPDGGLKGKFHYDDLLDIVMLHWINRCATSSFRFYAEIFNRKAFPATFCPIEVPTACSRFKYDFAAPDGVIRDVYRNLVHLKDYDGGHFAALENPDILSKDIFVGIAKIRELYGKNESFH